MARFPLGVNDPQRTPSPPCHATRDRSSRPRGARKNMGFGAHPPPHLIAACAPHRRCAPTEAPRVEALTQFPLSLAEALFFLLEVLALTRSQTDGRSSRKCARRPAPLGARETSRRFFSVTVPSVPAGTLRPIGGEVLRRVPFGSHRSTPDL